MTTTCCKTSMVSPLGVLPTGLAAATNEVVWYDEGGPLGVLPMGPAAATIKGKGDVDGGAPRGCGRWVRQ
jgi:hypothetical protein